MKLKMKVKLKRTFKIKIKPLSKEELKKLRPIRFYRL